LENLHVGALRVCRMVQAHDKVLYDLFFDQLLLFTVLYRPSEILVLLLSVTLLEQSVQIGKLEQRRVMNNLTVSPRGVDFFEQFVALYLLRSI
jgi:hypothetical protein